MLLNLDDPYGRLPQGPGSTPGQNTYRARNTLGLGYVRDDWLAEYAEREQLPPPVLQPLGQLVQVPMNAGTLTLQYHVRRGHRCAVVAAWFRHLDSGIPDIDLEVFDGSTLLARSDLPASSHERVVFATDGVDIGAIVPVTVKITVASANDYPPNFVLPVYVAGRELPAELQAAPVYAGTGRAISDIEQPPSCLGSSHERKVVRTIPTSYRDAYGSYPLHWTYLAGAGQTLPRGRNLARHLSNTIIDSSQVGGDFDARGIAFRSWAPFSSPPAPATLPLVRMWLYETTDPPSWVSVPGDGSSNPSTRQLIVTNMVLVYDRSTSPAIPITNPNWTARSPETWTIAVPFSATYRFRGTSAGRHLGIWIETDYTVQSPPAVEVDWVTDGSSLYQTAHAYLPPRQFSGIVFPGDTPVFGLIEEAPEPAKLPPWLAVLGEPRLGEELTFRIEQLPPLAVQSAPVLLNVAIPPRTTSLINGCNFLTGSTLIAVTPGAVPGNGWPWVIAKASAFSDQALLDVDLHWQAIVLSGGQLTPSNVVTTRFGGFR